MGDMGWEIWDGRYEMGWEILQNGLTETGRSKEDNRACRLDVYSCNNGSSNRSLHDVGESPVN
jgi:hypothetical protein